MNQHSRYKKIIFLKHLLYCSIVFATAFFFLFFTSQTNAQSPLQSLSISPIVNDLQLFPGKKTTLSITVKNNNNTSVGIHTETTGYDITGETSIFEQKQSVMTNWTTLSQNDLLLDKNQSKDIVVTINTPNYTRQSGYYETIFLTPIAHQQQVANSPIILSRFGVLVLGTVGKLNYNDLAKKVTVSDITPSFTILNTFPSTISFSVANTYFTHFDAKPFITITPLFANSQTTLLTDKHVLPGSKRIWQYMPIIAKNHIFYHMHLAVSIGDGKQIFSDTWFIIFPYQTLLLVCFVLILFYILTKKRKRLRKFVTILIKG
jgi:hypothetical protein